MQESRQAELQEHLLQQQAQRPADTGIEATSQLDPAPSQALSQSQTGAAASRLPCRANRHSQTDWTISLLDDWRMMLLCATAVWVVCLQHAVSSIKQDVPGSH